VSKGQRSGYCETKYGEKRHLRIGKVMGSKL